MKVSIKRRAWNMFVSVDQLIYVVVTLGAGNPDETLSSAAYRTEKDGKVLGKIFRPPIDWFFGLFGEAEHCKTAFNKDIMSLTYWNNR